MTRLTDNDLRTIAAVRDLRDRTAGPAAVREYVGDPEFLTAYVVAFERAVKHLGALLDIIGRLAVDKPAPRGTAVDSRTAMDKGSTP